ncbi:MAG: hypothetical protein HOV87_05260 [Catenulispora sp.]|nr:hypothetical protein [Catenulispora sp.]
MRSRLHSYLPDGSGDIAITADGPTVYSPDLDPAVAPDGTVAFARGTAITLAALDGSSAGREYTLYSGNTDARHPAWAADGSLLFERTAVQNPGNPGPTPQPDVYRFANGAATLFLANAAQPAVSPDGNRIAFLRTDSRGIKQVFTAGANGVSSLTQITHGDTDATEPSWSPDGSTLAYVMPTWNEVIEVPAAGGARRRQHPERRRPGLAAESAAVARHPDRRSGSDPHRHRRLPARLRRPQHRRSVP